MFRQTELTIVGLAGGSGVGKDTVAAQHFTNYDFSPVALADEIKRRVVASGKATWEEVFITKPPHIRELLQQEGTERGRDVYGADYWIDQLLVNLGYFNIRWGMRKFVVTDIRFPNEVTRLQQAGGKVYRIDAPQRYASNGLTPEARAHRSERSLDDFTAYDGVILNDIGMEATVAGQIANLIGGTRAATRTQQLQEVRLGVAARTDYA